MNAGRKEKGWTFAGLGIALIGCAWFGLAIAGAFDGLAMMLGYFLGIGLALGGLIVAGVYFFRWQRIQKLLRGEDALVKWANGAGQAIISPTSALVDGELYLWGVRGTRLENVQIERGASPGSEQSYLRITIGEATSARDPLTRAYLWRERKLSIPIPPGQDLAAQSVCEQLNSRLEKGRS